MRPAELANGLYRFLELASMEDKDESVLCRRHRRQLASSDLELAGHFLLLLPPGSMRHVNPEVSRPAARRSGRRPVLEER